MTPNTRPLANDTLVTDPQAGAPESDIDQETEHVSSRGLQSRAVRPKFPSDSVPLVLPDTASNLMGAPPDNPATALAEGPDHEPRREPMFDARGVDVEFKSGGRILSNFTWAGDPGLNVIVGPSGSGKSTLLKVFSGLLRPDRGYVCLGRQAVPYEGDPRSQSFLKSQVAFVHQDLQLIPHLSAIGNVALPLQIQGIPKREAYGIARKMLNRLGIVNHKQRNHLSGGEELRVALARALIGPAKVIFADEPTGSLDPNRSHDVMRLFKEVVRTEGKSVLLVTHDPQLAHQFGDKVFEMGRSGLTPLSPNDSQSPPSAAEGGQA